MQRCGFWKKFQNFWVPSTQFGHLKENGQKNTKKIFFPNKSMRHLI